MLVSVGPTCQQGQSEGLLPNPSVGQHVDGCGGAFKYTSAASPLPSRISSSQDDVGKDDRPEDAHSSTSSDDYDVEDDSCKSQHTKTSSSEPSNDDEAHDEELSEERGTLTLSLV